MNRLVVLLVLLGLASPSCRSKRHIGEEFPFRSGFQSIRWGAPVSAVDSLTAKDTAWTKISSIDNLSTNGTIVVMKNKGREYYLEFDDRSRFFMMNYISGKQDLDTVRNRLQRYYGEPDRSGKGNENYQDRTWHIDADSIQLEIQLLETQKQYALKVLNKLK